MDNKDQTMGNKEWPDDWKVGNAPARATLGCMVAPLVGIALGLLFRWGWAPVTKLMGWG